MQTREKLEKLLDAKASRMISTPCRPVNLTYFMTYICHLSLNTVSGVR